MSTNRQYFRNIEDNVLIGITHHVAAPFSVIFSLAAYDCWNATPERAGSRSWDWGLWRPLIFGYKRD